MDSVQESVKLHLSSIVAILNSPPTVQSMQALFEIGGTLIYHLEDLQPDQVSPKPVSLLPITFSTGKYDPGSKDLVITDEILLQMLTYLGSVEPKETQKAYNIHRLIFLKLFKFVTIPGTVKKDAIFNFFTNVTTLLSKTYSTASKCLGLDILGQLFIKCTTTLVPKVSDFITAVSKHVKSNQVQLKNSCISSLEHILAAVGLQMQPKQLESVIDLAKALSSEERINGLLIALATPCMQHKTINTQYQNFSLSKMPVFAHSYGVYLGLALKDKSVEEFYEMEGVLSHTKAIWVKSISRKEYQIKDMILAFMEKLTVGQIEERIRKLLDYLFELVSLPLTKNYGGNAGEVFSVVTEILREGLLLRVSEIGKKNFLVEMIASLNASLARVPTKEKPADPTFTLWLVNEISFLYHLLAESVNSADLEIEDAMYNVLKAKPDVIGVNSPHWIAVGMILRRLAYSNDQYNVVEKLRNKEVVWSNTVASWIIYNTRNRFLFQTDAQDRTFMMDLAKQLINEDDTNETKKTGESARNRTAGWMIAAAMSKRPFPTAYQYEIQNDNSIFGGIFREMLGLWKKEFTRKDVDEYDIKEFCLSKAFAIKSIQTVLTDFHGLVSQQDVIFFIQCLNTILKIFTLWQAKNSAISKLISNKPDQNDAYELLLTNTLMGYDAIRSYAITYNDSALFTNYPSKTLLQIVTKHLVRYYHPGQYEYEDEDALMCATNPKRRTALYSNMYNEIYLDVTLPSSATKSQKDRTRDLSLQNPGQISTLQDRAFSMITKTISNLFQLQQESHQVSLLVYFSECFTNIKPFEVQEVVKSNILYCLLDILKRNDENSASLPSVWNVLLGKIILSELVTFVTPMLNSESQRIWVAYIFARISKCGESHHTVVLKCLQNILKSTSENVVTTLSTLFALASCHRLVGGIRSKFEETIKYILNMLKSTYPTQQLTWILHSLYIILESKGCSYNANIHVLAGTVRQLLMSESEADIVHVGRIQGSLCQLYGPELQSNEKFLNQAQAILTILDAQGDVEYISHIKNRTGAFLSCYDASILIRERIILFASKSINQISNRKRMLQYIVSFTNNINFALLRLKALRNIRLIIQLNLEAFSDIHFIESLIISYDKENFVSKEMRSLLLYFQDVLAPTLAVPWLELCKKLVFGSEDTKLKSEKVVSTKETEEPAYKADEDYMGEDDEEDTSRNVGLTGNASGVNTVEHEWKVSADTISFITEMIRNGIQYLKKEQPKYQLSSNLNNYISIAFKSANSVGFLQQNKGLASLEGILECFWDQQSDVILDSLAPVTASFRRCVDPMNNHSTHIGYRAYSSLAYFIIWLMHTRKATGKGTLEKQLIKTHLEGWKSESFEESQFSSIYSPLNDRFVGWASASAKLLAYDPTLLEEFENIPEAVIALKKGLVALLYWKAKATDEKGDKEKLPFDWKAVLFTAALFTYPEPTTLDLLLGMLVKELTYTLQSAKDSHKRVPLDPLLVFALERLLKHADHLPASVFHELLALTHRISQVIVDLNVVRLFAVFANWFASRPEDDLVERKSLLSETLVHLLTEPDGSTFKLRTVDAATAAELLPLLSHHQGLCIDVVLKFAMALPTLTTTWSSALEDGYCATMQRLVPLEYAEAVCETLLKQCQSGSKLIATWQRALFTCSRTESCQSRALAYIAEELNANRWLVLAPLRTVVQTLGEDYYYLFRCIPLLVSLALLDAKRVFVDPTACKLECIRTLTLLYHVHKEALALFIPVLIQYLLDAQLEEMVLQLLTALAQKFPAEFKEHYEQVSADAKLIFESAVRNSMEREKAKEKALNPTANMKLDFSKFG